MTTTQVNADTAVGGDAMREQVSFTPQPSNRRTLTFKRTAQHYITNNNTSSAPTVTFVNNTTPVVTDSAFPNPRYAVYDQGYVNIPYSNPNMTITTTDWDQILISARKMRYVNMGYSIKRISPCQQQVAVQASTTAITNSFTQAPVIMMVFDNDHSLASISTITTENPPAQRQTIFRQPGIANVGFALSFAGGQLPPIQTLIPINTSYTSIAANFDILIGGDFKLMSGGEQHSHMWEAGNGRWFTPTINQTANPNSVVNLQAQEILTQLVGGLEQNLATEVTFNMLNPPPMHLLRVPPLFNSGGPITLNIELWIEYTCTIELDSGRYLESRNPDSASGGIFARRRGGSTIGGDVIPFPVFQRDLMNNQLTGGFDPELGGKLHSTMTQHDPPRKHKPYDRQPPTVIE